jgi:hypothetical protein
MRSAPESKELIEEVLPLAAFLKHLEIPGRKIRCRYVGGTDNYDARIRITGVEVERGFLAPSYFVEITGAAFPKDYLRREALTRNGHVFGGPRIRRVGSRARGTAGVVSEAAAVDGEAAVREMVRWTESAIARKAEKDYPEPTILLVDVLPDRPLRHSEWCSVTEEVGDRLDRTAFAHVYWDEWSSNSVFLL